jgi:hypothetical protein
VNEDPIGHADIKKEGVHESQRFHEDLDEVEWGRAALNSFGGMRGSAGESSQHAIS